MRSTTLEGFSDSSPAWIFGSGRTFTELEAAQILERLDQFCSSWKSHGAKVAATADVAENRFLVVAARDDSGTSGCSIDTLFREIGEIERQLGLSLRDASLIFFRNGSGDPVSAERRAFVEMGRKGSVDGDTIVFDLSVDTVGAVRQRFEQRVRDSWHRQLLPAPIAGIGVASGPASVGDSA